MLYRFPAEIRYIMLLTPIAHNEIICRDIRWFVEYYHRFILSELHLLLSNIPSRYYMRERVVLKINKQFNNKDV